MMEKRYFWKDLSSDGLLKEPDPIGPYYDQISLNGVLGDGFETEEEALERLQYVQNVSGHFIGHFMLISLYTPEKKNDDL